MLEFALPATARGFFAVIAAQRILDSLESSREWLQDWSREEHRALQN